MKPQSKRYHALSAPPILTLWLAFGLAVSRLAAESLWEDEAWSMWAVRGSLVETVQRVAADVHPPLYFAALDSWVALTGESVYAVRLLSTLFGLLGLAATYRLGRTLFDRRTGSIAALLLGTTGFFLYYSRDVRMYTLLLSLAALSMLAYVRWLRRPAPGRVALYALTIAALPYTHYYGWLIALTQGLHLLLTRPRRWRGWFSAGGLALLLYAPWLPVWLQQIRAHPDGPLARPLPTNLETITWLLIILSGGAGLWLFVPFLLGRAVPYLRQRKQTGLLLGLWLAVTPFIVLAVNAWVAPAYQVRYVIAVLPAVALLAAYGLRYVWRPPLAVVLLLGFVYANLTAYDRLWPPKTSWGLTVANSVIQTRQPGEPSLVMIVKPYSLEAYYDRQVGLRNAAALDLSGERYSPAQMQAIVASVTAEPSVWVMMPHNIGETWQAIAALNAQRHIGYRNNAAYMLFYRFDRGNHNNLQFRFGDKLGYQGRLFASAPPFQPGDRFCLDLKLTALAPLDDLYSYGLHLVDAANGLVAQQDRGLGRHAGGEQIELTPCLDLPASLPAGHYYAHLVIYTWADGARLPLFEGDAGRVYWGDALVLGSITVE